MAAKPDLHAVWPLLLREKAGKKVMLWQKPGCNGEKTPN